LSGIGGRRAARFLIAMMSLLTKTKTQVVDLSMRGE
jgi:hypothetical protein